MKKFTALIIIFSALALGINVNTQAVSAGAYTVIEQSTGRVLYTLNGNKKMPMASTTKVMTALLVIENLDLDKEYTVPKEAVGIEGSSIYLTQGEKLTGKELLYGLMLASGNDAAYALAILTGGSSEKFVDMMNAKATELGLSGTKFADPCGLEYKNHYTTSNDLASLCAVAFENEIFREVVCTQNYKITGKDGENIRYLHNKNRILGEFAGGNGIKTGYTTAAGRCLCASAQRNGMQLICVVLNDHNWFEDSKTLMDKGFNEYSLIRIAKKGEIAGNVNIYGGKKEKCDIIYADDVFYPLKTGETVKGVSCAAPLNAPVNSGMQAGVYDYYIGDKKVISVPLLCNENIERKKSLFGR